MHQLKARDETGRRVRFYAALGLVTAATLMLQIIETRIISVTSWYHLAFFVISIAMFGLTAGAVFVYLRKDRFRPERLSYDLAVATLAFALTTDLAIVVQLTLVTGAAPSLTALAAWAEFALCLALPFFFSGIVVSLALTRSPYPIGKVYGADLIGAAIGCIGALVLLNVTSGPSAVLWVGAVIALAALGFAGSGLGELHESGAIGAKLFREKIGVRVDFFARPAVPPDHAATSRGPAARPNPIGRNGVRVDFLAMRATMLRRNAWSPGRRSMARLARYFRSFLWTMLPVVSQTVANAPAKGDAAGWTHGEPAC